MACCAPKHDPDEKVQPHILEDVKNKKRKYTDCFCFLLIIVHWVAMSIVGITFGSTANPQAIFAPSDYQGRLCGIDAGVANKPYGYVVNLNLDIVCVNFCPSVTKSVDGNNNAYDQMICKSEDVKDSYKDATIADDPTKYFGYLDLFCSDSTDINTCGYGHCNFKFESYNIGYYCMFNTDKVEMPSGLAAMAPGITDDVFSNFADDGANSESSSGPLGAFMQDMVTSLNWVACIGLLGSLLIAFIFTKLMSTMLLDMLVWGCIFITGALFVVLGAYSYSVYDSWKDDVTKSDTAVTGMQAVSIVFIVCAVLYWCLIICICSKIKLCIALTKTAGRAVRDVPLVVLFPIVQVAGLVLFLVPWTYYMLYLNSQGCYKKVENNDDGMDSKIWKFASSSYYQNNCDPPSYPTYDNTVYAQYYMMFCYFWTTQFIVAMGQIIMALTFFLWYFTEDPTAEVTAGEHDNCLKRTFCAPPHHGGRDDRLLFHAFSQSVYHIGSAAFGSLIIAIIKFIRYCILQLQKKAQKGVATLPTPVATACPALAVCWNAMAGSTIKIIFCCIQCCLCCIEKCMKFINKHAYIIIVIHGDVTFCSAAVRSFFLILRNIRLIAAITLVQEFVIIIGKFFVVVTTGCVSYILMERYIGDELNSLIGPVLFVMILAYFVADMFMLVYSMAIDVLMHCFMSDKEIHHENPSECYAVRDSCPHLHELNSFIEQNKEEERRRSSAAKSEERRSSGAKSEEGSEPDNTA
jgi:choline transporter-like protein 2/4/5